VVTRYSIGAWWRGQVLSVQHATTGPSTQAVKRISAKRSAVKRVSTGLASVPPGWCCEVEKCYPQGAVKKDGLLVQPFATDPQVSFLFSGGHWAFYLSSSTGGPTCAPCGHSLLVSLSPLLAFLLVSINFISCLPPPDAFLNLSTSYLYCPRMVQLWMLYIHPLKRRKFCHL
jgi:hypothetical protein